MEGYYGCDRIVLPQEFSSPVELEGIIRSVRRYHAEAFIKPGLGIEVNYADINELEKNGLPVIIGSSNEAFIYLAGHAYYGGFLDEWGVDSENELIGKKVKVLLDKGKPEEKYHLLSVVGNLSGIRPLT